MKKVLIIMLLFSLNVFASVAVEGGRYYMSDMTRLNPRDFRTHVLLCRIGNSRTLNQAEGCSERFINDNRCGCDSCTRYDRIGLGLAFITAYTRGQSITEYLKVDANTDNILWSSFCQFTMHSSDDDWGSSCIDTHCTPIRASRIRSGKLKFEYYYNNNYGKLNETTLREGFEETTAGPRISDDNSYPHNAEGGTVLKFPERFRGETNIHHLKRVLCNAVYGWTIDYMTIPEVLRKIGKACENIDNTRIVPQFNFSGVFGYNCAKFCAKVLSEFGFFSYQPPVDDRSIIRRSVKPLFRFIGGVCGISAAVSSGLMGLIGWSVVAGLDIGFGLTSAQEEIEQFKREVVIPNDILYKILEYYKTSRRNLPLSDFFVFAHDREEREASRTRVTPRETEVQMDYYNQFTLKSVSDIIRHNVSVDRELTEVFYMTLF